MLQHGEPSLFTLLSALSLDSRWSRVGLPAAPNCSWDWTLGVYPLASRWAASGTACHILSTITIGCRVHPLVCEWRHYKTFKYLLAKPPRVQPSAEQYFQPRCR